MSTLQNKAIACQTFESVSRTLLGLGPAGAETPEAASLTLQRVVFEDVVAEADMVVLRYAVQGMQEAGSTPVAIRGMVFTHHDASGHIIEWVIWCAHGVSWLAPVE